MTSTTPAAPERAIILFGRTPWWVIALEGAVLIALGLLAAMVPFIASLAATVFIGWIYLIAGAVRIASSVTHRGPGFGWSIVTGAVAVIAGLILVMLPLVGLLSLTLVLGAYFFVNAVTAFVAAAAAGRHTGRMAWMIAGGVADLVLAAIVFRALRAGAVWLLGLVVAVNLVFAGTSLLTLGIAWRAGRLPQTAA